MCYNQLIMFRWSRIINYFLIFIVGITIGWFGHSWKYQKEDVPEQMTDVTVVARFSENNISEFQKVGTAVGSSIADVLKTLEQKQLSYKLEEKNGSLKVSQLMGVDGSWECEVDGQLNQIGLDKFRLKGGEKIFFINKSATTTPQ